MENKVIKPRGPTIVIGGPAGSGKTTYAKRLAEDLKLDYYSAGQVFREIMSEKGLSLEDMNKLASQDPSIDLEIDRRAYVLASRGGVVLEGHLLAWIVRDVADVAIYVTAPLKVRLRRLAQRDGRRIEEVARETLVREWLQWKRFKEYYGIDTSDLSVFDLVVNTSDLTIEQAYSLIKSFVCAVLGRKGYSVC